MTIGTFGSGICMTMGMLGDVEIGKIIFATDHAVRYFTEHCKQENPYNKKGGVLLVENRYGESRHAEVGSTNEYDACLITSIKKLRHLESNPTHLSSFQGRDPEKGIWGGGVSFIEARAALSGLPELGAEACLLCGLFQAGVVSMKFVQNVTEMTSNFVLFEEIMEGAF